MRNIRWGILGPGHIARGFAAALRGIEGAELLSVGSRSLERAAGFASEFGFARSYGSYQSLADDPDVDVIYIATPHHLHFENTLLCLEKGKAVICEKPFTINSKQLEILIKTARKEKVFLMEALWTRFLPGIQHSIDILSKGKIGQVRMLTADFGFKAVYNPESRLFNPVLGGGSLLDIGIYPVFLSLLLLGYPDDIRAMAVKAPTGVDESVSICFGYKSGAMANLNCTFAAHTATGATVYGTEGSIHIKPQWFRPSGIQLYEGKELREELDFPPLVNGYEYEAMEVMKCLRDGKTESALLSLDFSLNLMKLLDEIRKICDITYNEYD